MLGKDNGDPRQCVANLLKITRGENPYERIKGIDAAVIDSSGDLSQNKAVAEIEWVIDTYEPRVEVEEINLDAVSETGDFSTGITIKLREEEDDGWQQGIAMDRDGCR